MEDSGVVYKHAVPIKPDSQKLNHNFLGIQILIN